MSLSRAGDPHRSQPPDGLLRADGAGVERAGPRRAGSPRRRRPPGSAVAPPPHARRERPRPPRRWGRRHCGVRRAPGHPRSSVAGWCLSQPRQSARSPRPTQRGTDRTQADADGRARTVAGTSRRAWATSSGSSPGNSAGEPAPRAASCNACSEAVGSSGKAATRTSERVRPTTVHSRAPARATTSRSPRVLAIGKRIPRAGEDERRRSGVSLDGRGLSRRTPQGGEAVPPERRERPDRVDQLHLQGTCLHGRLLLRATAVPGHGGSRGARVQGFDHDALDSP